MGASSFHTPDPGRLDGSSLESVPGRVLADLISKPAEAGDPALRDYGERYTYTCVIGEGGQGVVIAARDAILEREVAIKALKGIPDKTRERILEREARIGAILEHPNILPIYDLSHDETGGPLLVMRRIEGVSLEDQLRRAHAESGRSAPGELSRRRLLNIFLQVCHALEFAHSRGAYHLDIKPQNIKIGAFGEVYVFDWGFAARDDEEEWHRIIAGTPVYIAPERLAGGRPDARCDIYSLGVMLYRLLTNKLPRDIGRITFREYREKIGTLPIIPPRARDRSVPPDLEAIVMKAMADDPAARYTSVKALAEDLERFLDLLPVAAYGEGIFGRLWKFLRRHRRLAIAAGIALLALGVAGAATLRNARLEREAAAAKAREAEKERALAAQREAVRRRAAARVPLEKALEMVEKQRDRVEREAKAERRQEMLATALHQFQNALDRNPDYAEAWYERGRARLLALDHGGALEDLQRAVEIDRSLLMAHYHAGRIFADVYRDYIRAREQFEAMRGMDPDNEYSELGQAYIDLAEGRFEEALRRCDRIEKRNDAVAEVWYIRAFAFQKAGEAKKALAAYDRFLAVRLDNPSAFLNRGDIRKDLRDIDGALADYGAALVVDPNYKWALLNRGYLLYREKGRPQEGLQDIEAAIRIDANYWRSYLDRAAILEFLKDAPRAEKDYERARTLAPQNPLVWYRTGVFLFGQERLAEAEEALTRSIQLSEPAERGIRVHRRGIVRLARAEYADAVRDFEESIRLRQDGKVYPALMRWLALRLQGEPVEPAAFGRQLDAPADKPWLTALGSFFLGESKAAEVLRLATTPEAKCEVQFYLGAHALGRGDKPAAVAAFRAALATGAHLQMEFALARILLRPLEKR